MGGHPDPSLRPLPIDHDEVPMPACLAQPLPEAVVEVGSVIVYVEAHARRQTSDLVEPVGPTV